MAALEDFRWFGCGEPISEERIAAVQRRLGVRFPSSFLKCVRTCDGGDPGDFGYKVGVPGFEQPWTFGIGRLITFREPMPPDVKRRLLTEPDAWREVGIEPWTSIEDYFVDPPEGLQAGLTPFADTGSGDLLCFDWRNGKDNPNPPIVIWLHEFIEEEPVVYLAENFDAFVKSLEYSDTKALLDELEKGN